MKTLTDRLFDFLDHSTCCFTAAENICRRLDEAGFIPLAMDEPWPALKPGDRRYVVKNASAVFAFIVGTDPAAGFKIIAAHSDSPGFRIKPNPEMDGACEVLRLNTEVYGGPILYTWFDRPLSMAGRVVLRGDDPLHPVTRIVDFRRPLMVIPHLAIHFNRAVNEGNPLSRQRDMMPVAGFIRDQYQKPGFLISRIAGELGCHEAEILDYDLCLYPVEKACTVGFDNELISSGRIDDLEMAFCGLEALTADAVAGPDTMTRVLAVFDNEETGSGTKQGAASPVLRYVLERLTASSLVGSDGVAYAETLQVAYARSFLVSADNAHGAHPNYLDKADPTNRPRLGGGPVIKFNANCKYMTDADSAAVFRAICDRAGVPCQTFVNHSDIAGGSTLGNILTSQIPLRGVDMGAPQWAMHSCRETAAAADVDYIVKAFTSFFTAM